MIVVRGLTSPEHLRRCLPIGHRRRRRLSTTPPLKLRVNSGRGKVLQQRVRRQPGKAEVGFKLISFLLDDKIFNKI
jgi:hypothetical protein